MVVKKVSVESISPEKGILFKTNSNVFFYLMHYEKGIATIKFSEITGLAYSIITVVSLFDEKSNFCGCLAIRFEFCGIVIEVTKEKASEKDAYASIYLEYIEAQNRRLYKAKDL